MPKIRVLVVDDAVVVRRLVVEALNGDPEIEVVGTASNGKIALDLLPQLAPDAVTLDVEMPELDGLATLKAVRIAHPKLPVVMLSALTERGGSITLDCLAAGASGYVTKPSAANMGSAVERLRAELAPMLKAFCAKVSAAPAPLVRTAPAAPHRRTDPEILAIGVSTGGPNALAELIPALPADFPLPVVVVQHMPPVFTRLLAERLAAKSRLSVVEAVDGDRIVPGKVFIAPGDRHLVLERRGDDVVAVLTQDPPENSCRPAVDPLFRSVGRCFGGRVLALVLTGMGRDGLRGCEVLKEAGAEVLVQDEATSVVWGMPGFVARAGLADDVLPLSKIAAEVVRRAGRGATVPSTERRGEAASLRRSSP